MQRTFGNVSSEFHFGQEKYYIPKYGKGGGGEVAATYGVRASLFLSCFFYFSDKNGTYKLSLSGHSWKKRNFQEPVAKFDKQPIIPHINAKVERKDHLVPFYAVYAVAVHVEATIEDGRLAGLIKGVVGSSFGDLH